MGCINSPSKGSEDGNTCCVQGRELPGIAGVQDAGKALVEGGQAERIWIQEAPEVDRESASC